MLLRQMSIFWSNLDDFVLQASIKIKLVSLYSRWSNQLLAKLREISVTFEKIHRKLFTSFTIQSITYNISLR